MKVHVYHHFVDNGSSEPFTSLIQKVDKMANELANLTAKVAANTTVVESAITFISGLKDLLDQAIASGDPTKLQALSDQLDSEDQKLAAAIATTPPPTP